MFAANTPNVGVFQAIPQNFWPPRKIGDLPGKKAAVIVFFCPEAGSQRDKGKRAEPVQFTFPNYQLGKYLTEVV